MFTLFQTSTVKNSVSTNQLVKYLNCNLYIKLSHQFKKYLHYFRRLQIKIDRLTMN